MKKIKELLDELLACLYMAIFILCSIPIIVIIKGLFKNKQ